jgi:hypothetical protein
MPSSNRSISYGYIIPYRLLIRFVTLFVGMTGERSNQFIADLMNIYKLKPLINL